MSVKRYSIMWSRIADILNDTTSRVESIVREICMMVREDVGAKLDELAKELGFRYVIEPWFDGINCGGIVPCVYVEGKERDVEVVSKIITELFPDVVSESRLVFRHKPRKIPM